MGGAANIVDPLGFRKIFEVPKLPKAPDPLDPEEERRKARLAADRKRTLALGAFGSADTIKTGPSGLGATPQAFKGSKTLIGT